MENLLDLYTDFLLAVSGPATATKLSNMVEGAVSHDQVTRLLSQSHFTSKDLWVSVKKLVRQHETEDACLIFDDCIIEKPYMEENDLISWHFDHCKGRSVKGVNLLTALYWSQSAASDAPLRVPVNYRAVKKTELSIDKKTGAERRKSPTTKNDMLREMLVQCIHNQLKFRYVLADSWFSSCENMRFIHKRNKYFIFDMKSNRKAAMSDIERNLGQWKGIDELVLPDNTPTKVWLKDLEIPVLLLKQVFINKDSSVGVRFLVTNDFGLSGDQIAASYKKRWGVEEYHKSLKQHTAVGKSPARNPDSQNSHLYASILAYIKMERLKFVQKLNHFAIKSKLHLAATKASFVRLMAMKAEVTIA